MSLSNKLVWIIEDDPIYAKTSAKTLETRLGVKTEILSSPESCESHTGPLPDLIVLDYYLSGEGGKTGGDVLSDIKTQAPDLPVIIVSAQEDIETTMDLFHSGAWDYLSKNEDTMDELPEIASQLIRLAHAADEFLTTRKRRKKARTQIALTALLLVAIATCGFLIV